VAPWLSFMPFFKKGHIFGIQRPFLALFGFVIAYFFQDFIV